MVNHCCSFYSPLHALPLRARFSAFYVSLVSPSERPIASKLRCNIRDQAGKRLYVNLTDIAEVGVIDLVSRQFVAKWPLPDAREAHAIVLDEPNRRLFTAARKPARFIVFNTDTGRVVTSLPCVGVKTERALKSERHVNKRPT